MAPAMLFDQIITITVSKKNFLHFYFQNVKTKTVILVSHVFLDSYYVNEIFMTKLKQPAYFQLIPFSFHLLLVISFNFHVTGKMISAIKLNPYKIYFVNYLT